MRPTAMGGRRRSGATRPDDDQSGLTAHTREVVLLRSRPTVNNSRKFIAGMTSANERSYQPSIPTIKNENAVLVVKSAIER